MKQLSIDLANCYGIKKLQKKFDFSDQNVYAIYAPNGSMKSSLAQTFKDVADGVQSKDRIFPGRVCTRKITDENGADLPQQNILVLPPYDQFLGHTEKTSTLLVNNVLRKEYEQLHNEIDKSTEAFVRSLKELSGSKKDLENEISLTFMATEGLFYEALGRVKDEVRKQPDAPFADVRYDAIFDDRVLSLLATKDFKTAIRDYITKYNELLAASTFFKKGIFEYYNAGQIAKTLADNGFFAAKHTISLNANKKLEISTQKQLEELIAGELDNITKDKDLKKKFDEIKKLLEKNVTVREFQAYLVQHELLLPHLANVDLFKQQIWKSYFKTRIDFFEDVLNKYQQVEARKKEIEEEASKERTQWENVIDLFNDRFFVPFKLEAKNKIAVTLGHESMLSLDFTFQDGVESVPVEQDTLMKALSQGEKKALYILNIIFEVEVRRQARQETLFVVDDIADSFDYKNKYVIIQYLQDIAKELSFKQIVLTHNFDFFRTIQSRFVRYSHCVMASRSSTGVRLEQASGIQNVFVNDWKQNFFIQNRKQIASIPFIRNLIEFTKGEDDPDYLRLTSLVHWKADSVTVMRRDLDAIYINLFGGAGKSADADKPVVNLIFEEAAGCLKEGDGVNFEHKIVLSVAIRLAAERFMVAKIANPAFVAAIKENQTPVLLSEFAKLFVHETEVIKTLQNVVLMTPENIHLNSFMYEPILDMSDEHLRKLYAKVVALV